MLAQAQLSDDERGMGAGAAVVMQMGQRSAAVSSSRACVLGASMVRLLPIPTLSFDSSDFLHAGASESCGAVSLTMPRPRIRQVGQPLV